MELGNTIEIKLKSNTQTSYLIDAFHFPGKKTDTIILKDIYSVWKGKPSRLYSGEIAYGVSLLLQSGFYGNDEVVRTPITFTSLKKGSNGQAIHVDEETRHFILKPIIEKIKAMDDLELGKESIVPFDKPIVLNAQGAILRERMWGETTRYYFVGMKVRRFF